nr:DNA cytosine methyltransferase [Paenibacillus dendritiformis]
MTTVAFCEREPFPQKVLRKHWPNVPIYDDVCTLSREVLERDGIIGPGRAIDIISAGYPCQPFSNAGKRRGKEDDRHLWPEVKRLLSEIRPRWFVGENVAGHITLGLDDVLSDLESLGYTAQPVVIPACAVGAPHRRDRVFVLGYAECSGCGEVMADAPIERGGGLSIFERGSQQADADPDGCSQDVADTSSSGQQECDITAITDRSGHGTRGTDAGRSERSIESRLGRVLDGLSSWLDGYKWPAALGQAQYDWEPPRVATGVKDRVGRLKSLGNAVNPAQVYPILAAIKAIEDFIFSREGRA